MSLVAELPFPYTNTFMYTTKFQCHSPISMLALQSNFSVD